MSEKSTRGTDRTPGDQTQHEVEGAAAPERRTLVLSVAILLALIALAAIVTLRTCGPSDAPVPDDGDTDTAAEQSQWVKAPQVTGLEVVDAEEIIRAAGLEPVRYEGFSQDMAAGFIVSQYPGFNVPALSGDPVLLHVSIGNRTGGTVVPSLLRQSVQSAEQTIRDAGLEPVIVPLHTGSSDVGALAGQIPSPGARVPDGSRVGIIVVAESDPETEP